VGRGHTAIFRIVNSDVADAGKPRYLRRQPASTRWAYVSDALAYGWQNVATDGNVTIAGVDRLHARFNANAFSRREARYWIAVRPLGEVRTSSHTAVTTQAKMLRF